MDTISFFKSVLMKYLTCKCKNFTFSVWLFIHVVTNKCYVISKYVSQTPSKTASMRVKLGFHYAGDCPATTHSIEEFDKVQRS